MSEHEKNEPDMLAAGELLFERPWHFMKSAPALEFLPPADRVEIAFAGRSNVGKSSLINATTRNGTVSRSRSRRTRTRTPTTSPAAPSSR